MAQHERSKRKVWTPEETKGFLQCYKARKNEFLHARKKRFAYSRVLSDMIVQGFTDSSTTSKALENKMRTLLDSYKARKEKSLESKMRVLLDAQQTRIDSEEQRNSSSSIASYMMELEEIVGDAVAVAADDNASNVDPDEDSFVENSKDGIVLKYEVDEESMFDNDEPTSFLPIEISTTTPEASAIPTTAPSPAIASIQMQPSTAATEIPKSRRKRKTTREIYYEEKLKIMRKAIERKEVQRTAFLNAIEKSFRERSEILQRTEERKIEMLQKYLNKTWK